MMESGYNENLANKISDLTESLHRSTDVLSSADRMIDHYKDLNREQEHEIAKLQDDLYHMNKNKQYESTLLGNPKSSFKSTSREKFLADILSDSSSMTDQINSKTVGRSGHSVHFEDQAQLKNLEDSLSSISYRQNILEKELTERSRERNLDLTLQKELFSLKENETQKKIDQRLKKLQDKIDDDHAKWKSQHKEMKTLTQEMQSIRDLVKETATPKRQNIRSLEDEALDKDLIQSKKKASEDKEAILRLREELHRQDKERYFYESKIEEMKKIGEMKTNQLKILEDQLLREKEIRERLERNNVTFQNKANDLERERTQFANQMSDLKAEIKLNHAVLEQSSQDLPELKLLLERSERQRDKLSEHIFTLKNEVKSKDEQIQRLTDQIEEQKKRLSAIDAEKSSYASQAERSGSRYFELKNELESTYRKLEEGERKLKDAERSKQELKEKALTTLKEYRVKCRRYEQQLEENRMLLKNNEAERSRATARTKESETSYLKMQKEQQEILFEVELLKQELNERNARVASLLDEKSHVERTLTQVSFDTKHNEELKKDLLNLKEENSKLNSELLQETKRCQDFETLLRELHDKHTATKNHCLSLQQQLEDERELRASLVARLQEKNEMKAQKEMKKMEEKFSALENEKEELQKTVQTMKSKQEQLNTKLCEAKVQCNESKMSEERLTQRIKKTSEENARMRKQYHNMKQTYEQKIKTVESNVAMEIDEKNVLQNHAKQHEAETSRVKDLMKSVLDIVSRDADNLLNLLCHEVENLLPVKEIPDSMSPQQQKQLHEIREKFQSCYTISRTLKQRFQHQKTLIKKAQERIKSQLNELNENKNAHEEESEENRKTISTLENSQKKSDNLVLGQKKKIAILQDQVKDLSKHLEQCTNALQKSLKIDEERRNVLKEIESIKYEHFEKQRLDEDFYRQSEKLDVLTNQLNDAKNSLGQIQQESLDTTLFANRVIENFSSVSPHRKRRLKETSTEKRTTNSGRKSRKSLTFTPALDIPVCENSLEIDDLRSYTASHSEKKNTKNPRRRTRKPLDNDDRTSTMRDHSVDNRYGSDGLEPLSMTDEEFEKFFLLKNDTPPHMQSRKKRNALE